MKVAGIVLFQFGGKDKLNNWQKHLKDLQAQLKKAKSRKDWSEVARLQAEIAAYQCNGKEL